MSRIAEAAARAGRVAFEEETRRWDREQEAARDFLVAESPAVSRDDESSRGFPPASAAISEQPASSVPVRASESTIDFEFVSAIRRVFLAKGSKIRSVLFCTVPGESMSDVAWQAADVLASQSGRHIAFVEDPSRSVAPAVGTNQSRISRLGWYPPDEKDDRASGGAHSSQDHYIPTVRGERISDLARSFDFVVINATAAEPTDLIPLAGEVDGVIVLIETDRTRRDNAKLLVDALHSAQVPVLGVVLTGRDAPATARADGRERRSTSILRL